MVLKCALGLIQSIEMEKMEDALTTVQNNMRRINQMTSPTLATLSTYPL
jgi:hypothetical protein